MQLTQEQKPSLDIVLHTQMCLPPTKHILYHIMSVLTCSLPCSSRWGICWISRNATNHRWPDSSVSHPTHHTFLTVDIITSHRSCWLGPQRTSHFESESTRSPWTAINLCYYLFHAVTVSATVLCITSNTSTTVGHIAASIEEIRFTDSITGVWNTFSIKVERTYSIITRIGAAGF